MDDLLSLSEYVRWETLSLNGFHYITDLSALSQLKTLQSLSLKYFSCLEELSPLTSLKLHTLHLNDCIALKNVSPLTQLTTLTLLNLDGCSHIGNIFPLKDCPNLRELIFTRGCHLPMNMNILRERIFPRVTLQINAPPIPTSVAKRLP